MENICYRAKSGCGVVATLLPTRSILVLATLIAPDRAHAQQAVESARESPTISAATEQAVSDGSFSPLTMPARVGSTAAFAWGTYGYDTSRKGPIAEAITEVRLAGPLALRGGVIYSNSTNRMRPSVGARVQLLRQEKHGLDGSISVFYKSEGFTEPEGEIETTLALGHSFESLTLVGNLVYGQDPEGNERDGELRVTVFRRARRFSYGLDARTRFAIGAQHGSASATEPRMDGLGGPIGTYLVGPVALFAEAGPSVFRLNGTTRIGLATLAGLGSAF